MRNIIDELPDRRMELIDGQFLVGASIEGSRRLLKVLLESWDGNAALSLTPAVAPWIKALNLVYGFSYPADYEIPAAELRAKKMIPAQIQLTPREENEFQALTLANDLHMALQPCKGLETFGRDFMTKLGQHALLPSGMAVQARNYTLCNYYLDGPPDLAFEFVRDDALLRRHYDLYFQSGINELWVFNVVTGQIRTFAFGFDAYTNEFSGDSGVISSTTIPALQVEVEENWQHRKIGEDPFRIISAPTQQSLRQRSAQGGIKWDSLVFAPILDLEPFPISFDEFIAWTGETKFDGYDGRLVVGTPDGTRTIFGQLLMTFGLIEAVKFMPPTFWMQAINERLQQLQQQEVIQQKMWRTAHQAARLLHDKFNFTKIAVAGDLVNEATFGLWSRTTLIFPDLKRRNDYFAIYQALNAAVAEKVVTYYCDDYIPLEIRNTFSKMVFI